MTRAECHLVTLRLPVDSTANLREIRRVGAERDIIRHNPHPLNFLYPLDSSQATVKLIDWQSWRIDTGTDDLAYLMACHWPADQMVKSERVYIGRYYGTLLGQGLRGYSWDDCWYDYRASIVRCLFFLLAAWLPAQWESGTWWQRIQQGLAAYNRWDCTQVFNP